MPKAKNTSTPAYEYDFKVVPIASPEFNNAKRTLFVKAKISTKKGICPKDAHDTLLAKRVYDRWKRAAKDKKYDLNYYLNNAFADFEFDPEDEGQSPWKVEKMNNAGKHVELTLKATGSEPLKNLRPKVFRTWKRFLTSIMSFENYGEDGFSYFILKP